MVIRLDKITVVTQKKRILFQKYPQTCSSCALFFIHHWVLLLVNYRYFNWDAFHKSRRSAVQNTRWTHETPGSRTGYQGRFSLCNFMVTGKWVLCSMTGWSMYKLIRIIRCFIISINCIHIFLIILITSYDSCNMPGMKVDYKF